MTHPQNSNHTADDLAPAEADDDDLDRLKAELQHNHLPKLAEAGCIDWDAETQTIRRGPNFDEIALLLRLIDDHRDELPVGARVTSKQLELDGMQYPEQVCHHLQAALDATATAEKHFHIREALQLVHIEKR